MVTVCGQLILRKISKIGATRCQILRLKTPNSISTGANSAPPDLLAVCKGPTSKGKEGNGEGKGKGRGGPPFLVGIGPPKG